MSWRNLAIMTVVSMTASAHAQSPESEAKTLAKRFLDHMAADVPVAGTFELKTAFDLAWLREVQRRDREAAAAKGLGVSFQTDSPLRVCNWAWDGSRELLSTLPGSNTWETFYRTEEAYLRGIEPRNFNLDKPSLSPGSSPASFYLLLGRRPWDAVFAESEQPATEPAPDGTPPGSVTLVLRSPRDEVRLLIDRHQGTLHQYQWSLAGKPLARLDVAELKRSTGHRVFPVKATLTLLNTETGSPIKTDTLTALDLRFPVTPQELSAAFALSLPPGAAIHDLMLNRVTVLERSTPLQEIVAGTVPSTPMDAGTPSPGPNRASRWSLPGLFVAGGVLVVVLFFLKRARASKTRAP